MYQEFECFKCKREGINCPNLIKEESRDSNARLVFRAGSCKLLVKRKIKNVLSGGIGAKAEKTSCDYVEIAMQCCG